MYAVKPTHAPFEHPRRRRCRFGSPSVRRHILAASCGENKLFAEMMFFYKKKSNFVDTRHYHTTNLLSRPPFVFIRGVASLQRNQRVQEERRPGFRIFADNSSKANGKQHIYLCVIPCVHYFTLDFTTAPAKKRLHRPRSVVSCAQRTVPCQGFFSKDAGSHCALAS